MNEKYLVINAGSSSLKFSLYAMPEAKEIVNGNIEKIGEGDSFYTLKYNGAKIHKDLDVTNHTEAVEAMLSALFENGIISDITEIKGVGHRVLHGGEFYSESIKIDDEVLQNIIDLTKLGPLHHPGEIAGIKSMMECLHDVPQVAVFDTAFHQTMPKENYMYAVPYDWYETHGVRKYGFHGTSHKYITQTMKQKLNRDDINLIVCHIGSGASLSCIKDGKCFDTTMGLTPLDGLIMGTRCGNIDASIVEYMCSQLNADAKEITSVLNKKSGILGLAGKNDMRDLDALAASGDEKAILAQTMFRQKIVDYIAQYYLKLNGKIDALVFTAGIGENNSDVRAFVVNKLAPLGIKLNSEMNDKIAKFKEIQVGTISTEDSTFAVEVIPTNEEYMILKDTYDIINQSKLTR